nr:transposase [Providencia stuartii]
MKETPCQKTSSHSPQVQRKSHGFYTQFITWYWHCTYHRVWIPKYRYKMLKDKVVKALYRTIYILCNMKDCEALALNVQSDLVHSSVSIKLFLCSAP